MPTSEDALLIMEKEACPESPIALVLEVLMVDTVELGHLSQATPNIRRHVTLCSHSHIGMAEKQDSKVPEVLVEIQLIRPKPDLEWNQVNMEVLEVELYGSQRQKLSRLMTLQLKLKVDGVELRATKKGAQEVVVEGLSRSKPRI